MSEKKEPREEQGASERPATERGLPRWKKVLLAVAAAMVVVGLGLGLAGGGSEPEPAGGPGSGGPAPNSLVIRSGPGGSATTSSAAEVESEESTWSPFLVKGGFSFVLAFCVGYALRTFLKVSMLVAGVLAAGLFALGYAGVVDVDWNTIGGWYDSAVAKVRAEASGFRTFVSGSLPSAGMAALGLVTGFKKS